MGKGTFVVLCAAALVAGCDGGSGGAEDGDTGNDGAASGPPADTGAGPPATTRALEDPLIGYSLRLPAGWSAPASGRPGTPVALRGGGEGCTVGTAGTLPRTGDLVAYARREAVRSAARGAVVEVEPVRGANVAGALARIGRRDAGARSALFVSAGGGVAITCSGRGERLRRLDRELPELFRSVRLDREPALERLQPEVAAVPAVRGAALRRERAIVAVRVTLEDPAAVRPAVRAVLGLVAGGVRDAQITVTAVDPRRPQPLAVGRTASGADQAQVQVGSELPITVVLR